MAAVSMAAVLGIAPSGAQRRGIVQSRAIFAGFAAVAGRVSVLFSTMFCFEQCGNRLPIDWIELRPDCARIAPELI
jgi:hypothetical protein